MTEANAGVSVIPAPSLSFSPRSLSVASTEAPPATRKIGERPSIRLRLVEVVEPCTNVPDDKYQILIEELPNPPFVPPFKSVPVIAGVLAIRVVELPLWSRTVVLPQVPS